MSVNQTLIYNIGDLVTCGPLVQEKRFTFIKSDDLGRLKDAWLVLDADKVKDLGAMPVPQSYLQSVPEQIDAKGRLVLPGLVDSHTHPLFAGARYQEFAMRLNGCTYQEIAEQGGGIKATVTATRQATNADLLNLLNLRLKKFLAFGVTSLEVKSGYGLSVAEEIRQLQILRKLQNHVPQKLRITCLALHAASPEHPDIRSYADEVSHELLPEIAQLKLADYVDAFIEKGYFSVEDCEPYFAKAKDLGLGIRLHADEFSDAKAAQAAARWQAASADHLQFASEAGIKAMAAAQVVATILPGTSLYTAISFTNARRFVEAGCPLAIASDFNPGSCTISNLPMLATIAGLHCGLNMAEIIAGITYVPAFSLGLADRKGALVPRMDGDLIIHSLHCLEEWLADMGQTHPRSVWIKGKQVWDKSQQLSYTP